MNLLCRLPAQTIFAINSLKANMLSAVLFLSSALQSIFLTHSLNLLVHVLQSLSVMQMHSNAEENERASGDGPTTTQSTVKKG